MVVGWARAGAALARAAPMAKARREPMERAKIMEKEETEGEAPTTQRRAARFFQEVPTKGKAALRQRVDWPQNSLLAMKAA
ncbi:MAG: hypothetical protein NVS3B25_28880 [Hymenobacter sp.]